MEAAISIAVELLVIGMAVILFFDARKQGLRWISILGSGMLFGLGIEWVILHGDSPSYFYGKQFLLDPGGLPIWIGIGWGSIIYAATWTAYQLKLPAWLAPFAAGYLAVNIDLSFDPVAADREFWTWQFVAHPAQCDLRSIHSKRADKPVVQCYGLPGPILVKVPSDEELRAKEETGVLATVDPPDLKKEVEAAKVKAELRAGTSPVVSFYGVPFHNFAGWFMIVASYVASLTVGFRCMASRYYLQRPGFDAKRWHPLVEWLVPLVALVPALGTCVLIRFVADRVKFGENHVTDLVVFFVVFVASAYLFYRCALRAETNGKVNRATLGLAALFHLMSLALAVIHIGRHPTLAVAILTNLTVGMFAFAWPFIDTLAADAKRREEEKRAQEAAANYEPAVPAE